MPEKAIYSHTTIQLTHRTQNAILNIVIFTVVITANLPNMAICYYFRKCHLNALGIGKGDFGYKICYNKQVGKWL